MTTNNKTGELNTPKAITAGCLISAFGALMFNILPLFLGSVQDGLGFDDHQLGLITSAYFVGFTLSTLSAFYWVRKFDWRKATALLSISTLLVCVMLSRFDSFVAYLGLLALLGASTSAIYAIGTTYLGDTENPARSYGFKIGGEAALGALLLFMLPPLVLAQWGLQGLLVSLIVVFGALALFISWLPRRGVKDTDPLPHVEGHSGTILMPVVLSLFAFFVFFGGVSALWAFMERVGHEAGFSPTKVGLALSVSMVGATLGSFVVAAIGARFGYMKPMLFSLVVMVLALLALDQSGYAFFFIGATLFSLSFGSALPIQVTIVSYFDATGEYVVLTALSIALGGIAGPALAGYLKAPGGNTAVLLMTGVAVAISVLIYAFVFQYARAHRVAQSKKISPSNSPF